MLTPKNISSRLMAMKFMQRGAAAAAAAAASTPEAGSPATPKTDDEGSAAKRRKTAHTSAPNTPATPVYDQQAYKKAMEEEEQKQRAAVERRAAELGDSHWVLPAAKRSAKSKARPLLNIVQVGFAQIDFAATPAGSEELPESVNLSSQARFRQFNMKKSKVRTPMLG